MRKAQRARECDGEQDSAPLRRKTCRPKLVGQYLSGFGAERNREGREGKGAQNRENRKKKLLYNKRESAKQGNEPNGDTPEGAGGVRCDKDETRDVSLRRSTGELWHSGLSPRPDGQEEEQT